MYQLKLNFLFRKKVHNIFQVLRKYLNLLSLTHHKTSITHDENTQKIVKDTKDSSISQALDVPLYALPEELKSNVSAHISYFTSQFTTLFFHKSCKNEDYGSCLSDNYVCGDQNR